MPFPESREIFKKEQINLNTVVAIVGFLSMFATVIATWSSVQYKQTATEDWQKSHEELHATIKADSAAMRAAFTIRLDGITMDVNKLVSKVENLEYRVTNNEKGVENGDTRVSRITESYGNQFTEIRGQLALLNTQVALANDSLKRLENLDVLPREYQGKK